MNDGILKKIVDSEHVIFNDFSLGDIYVGNKNIFFDNLIGQHFQYNLYERFELNEIFKNKNGEWKLINFLKLNDNTSYFLKNNINLKIIELTLPNNGSLNNKKLGDNFDVNMIKCYKMFEWFPQYEDGFEEITILNFLGNHIKAKNKNNNLILICFFDQNKIPNSYLGQKVYVNIIPKFLSTVIIKSKEQFLYKSLKYYIENRLKSEVTNDFLQIRNSEDKCIIFNSLLNDINLSDSILLNYIPVFFTSHVVYDKKGKWTLLSIINFDLFNIHIFELKGELYGMNISHNINLKSLIGNKFSVIYNSFKLINSIHESEDGQYIFKSIIHGKYVFEDRKTSKQFFAILSELKTPAESNVGKKFNLDTKKIIYCLSINDVFCN
uniref:Uncharacterized protein n=1 Tax=viral metagenome TaxID=1070528 RepID=A0A6C0AF69_9ZZZZ